MATQDFALSYTVEIPALFNDPPEGGHGPAGTVLADVVSANKLKNGPAGTLFADVITQDMQGPAGTLFANTANLKAIGPTTEFSLTGLCDTQNRLGNGPPLSSLGTHNGGAPPPPYNDLTCD